MLNDSKLSFVPYGTPLSLVAGTAVSPLIIDLLGVGVGQAPPNVIGNKTVFGADFGIGQNRVELATVVGTTFTTGTSATLNVQLQGAPDTGSGGSYLPGTWTTIVETGAIPAANLTAETFIGRFPVLPYPLSALPRYLRLRFEVASGTSFTAGTIGFSVMTMGRDDQANKFAASNYIVD